MATHNLVNRGLILFFVLIVAMPIRLWFSLGPFKTISILEITIWILFGWLLLLSPSRHLKTGPRPLFIALYVPVIIATISFFWSECLFSTLKMVFISATALLGYLLIINVFKNCSSLFILNCIGLFLIIAIFIAILYWTRLPFVSVISDFSLEGPKLSKLSLHPVAFFRFDNPFIGKSNDFAPILSLYLFFFIGVAMVTSKKQHFALAIISAMGLLFTLSRGAIIVSFGILFFLIIKNLSMKTIAITLISLLLIVILFNFLNDEIEKKEGVNILKNRLGNIRYIEIRFERYKYALDTISQSLILGQGGGNYMGKDIDEIDSAIHNTYLQQLSAYGIVFGSIMIFSLLILPWFFFRLKSNIDSVRTVARFIGMAIISFLIICTNQTANEAVIPSLMFRIFLGFSVAYLDAFYSEQKLLQKLLN